MSLKKIDIIIPFSDTLEQLDITLDSLYQQKNYINKIIIVVSGLSKYSLFKFLKQKYFHLEKLINLTIDMSNNTTPATARNIGILLSKSDYIGFLDSGMKANSKWLSSFFSTRNSLEIRIGSTNYIPNSFQSLLGALLTYGTKPSYNTVPGTIIKKNLCENFQNNMRFGEDIIWKRNYKSFLNKKVTFPCEYSVFPSNIIDVFLKYFKSEVTSAMHDREIYTKLNLTAFKIILIYSLIIFCAFNFSLIISLLILSIYFLFRLLGKNKLNYVFRKPAILAYFLQFIIDCIKVAVFLKISFKYLYKVLKNNLN